MKTLFRFFKSNPPPSEKEAVALADVFIGQQKIRQELTSLFAAGSPLPHLLFAGPSASGRKTLAQWLAKKTGQPLRVYDSARFNTVTDLIFHLAETPEGSLIVLENLEKIPAAVALALADILKNFSLTFPHPKTNQPTNWQTAHFTLLGLTTQPAKLPAKLLAAFAQVFQFPPYSHKEIAQIIHGWGRIPFPLALRLVSLTGGRLALAKEIYPLLLENKSEAETEISLADLEKAAALIEIDENFLTKEERAFLGFLCAKERPVKEAELAYAVNFTPFLAFRKKYLESVGLIKETPAGWQASLKTRLCLGKLKPYDREVTQLLTPELKEKAAAKLIAEKEQSLPYLVDFLLDPSPQVKTAVYRLLAALDESAFPELERLLASEITALPEKETILQLLSESQSLAALTLLQKVAGGDDLALKLTAIKCLGFSGQKKAIPFLIRLLKKEAEPVQLTAVAALQQLNTLEIISPLKSLLKSVSFPVQKAILNTLRQVGDASVVGLINKEKGLKHGKR